MNKYFLIFFVLLTVIGCAPNNEDVQMKEINNQWGQNQKQTFVFDIKDAEQPKNIIFIVRNNNQYPYNNLFLISSFKAEKEKTSKVDTLNYLLAKPTGEWIGTGFGETKEALFLYQSQYKFPSNGKYLITLQHGMRTKTLKGIEDIGVKIENSTQP